MNDSEITAQPIADAKCPLCGAALPTELAPLAETACPSCGKGIIMPGRLGQYKLTRLIGRGGMGAVYEGYDEGLDRKVAVKVILKSKADEDPAFIESFRKEAKAAAKLNNNNIVAVYIIGESEGQPFLAMELVLPDSLDRMMTNGPVMPATVLNIGCQIAQGLKAAADQGLVHGDVKPENILINEERTAKLADFGIAALMSASAASKNEVWGTPYYIAPETLRKQKVDFRADMYSLGGTLYHAIAGVPPFEGADMIEVMKKRLEGPARNLKEVVPGCPDGIAKIIMRMLEAEPMRRFPNYDALIKEMQKELAALKHTIGGGKRIQLKGAKAKTTTTSVSVPMPSVANPNAPLVPKQEGLSKKTLIAIASGIGVGVIVLITIPIILIAGSKEATPDGGTPEVSATAPAVVVNDGKTERAEILALGQTFAERSVASKNAEGEADKILKRLVSRAKRAVLPEHEAFLEPSSEEAPTELLKALQKAHKQRDSIIAQTKALTELREKLDAAYTADNPISTLAELKAEIDVYEKTPEAVEASKALAALQRTMSAWDKTVARGRDEMVKEVQRRQEEERKAREAERKAEAARKAQEAIDTEVASIDDIEASVRGDVDKFNPESALASFNARVAKLKSTEAKTKAKLAAEKIEVYARFKKWLIDETTAGNLAAYGITEATNETITYKGKTTKWIDFVADQQPAIVRIINGKLVDDIGAKSLAVSKRAELAVSAYSFIHYYIGSDKLTASKTLQGIAEKLRNQADDLSLTREELKRVMGDVAVPITPEKPAEETSEEDASEEDSSEASPFGEE